MPSTVKEDAATQWHPTVALEDFVRQVACLVEIVDMTRTAKLSLFDHQTIKRAMGWGSYIEEVMGSLTSESQHQRLAEALVAGKHKRPLHPEVATMKPLREARRWVLRSMLGSAFLADHPKPMALLKWIMTEYKSIGHDEGGGAAPKQEDTGAEGCPTPLPEFVADVSHVVRACAYTAVLSHAYSALMACARSRPRPAPSGGKGTPPEQRTRPAHEALDSGSNPGECCSVDSAGDEASTMLYQTSIESAQKRAYASSCWVALASMPDRDGQEGTESRHRDPQGLFLDALGDLARREAMVLEVMCLMLLEPCTTTTLEIDHLSKHWVRGSHSHTSGDTRGRPPVAKPRLTQRLLRKVMEFGSDPVLWQLDPWLLADVSDRHLPFADAYVAQLLKSLREATQAELDQAPDSILGGSESGRVKHLKGRLRALSSKSRRLNTLCSKALAQMRFLD